MKQILTIAFALLCLSGYAQTQELGILDRFTDPAKGRTVFISKGHRAAGISGTYRYLNVGGEQDGDGYQILSMFNIGNGSLHYYSVAPSYSWFAADDFSLGIRLEYTGYTLDSDFKMDLRQVTGSDDPDLNLQLMCRHMQSNSFGASFTARRYVSFFGSKMIAVFGEGRLYGKYGRVTSWPLHPLARQQCAYPQCPDHECGLHPYPSGKAAGCRKRRQSGLDVFLRPESERRSVLDSRGFCALYAPQEEEIVFSCKSKKNSYLCIPYP